MRIVAVQHVSFPSTKAHAIQIAHMSAALEAETGGYELWCPVFGSTPDPPDLQALYALPVPVRIRPIRVPYTPGEAVRTFGAKLALFLGFRLNSWVFSVRALRRLSRERPAPELIYTRHVPFAFLWSLIPGKRPKTPLAFEIHNRPEGRFARALWRRGIRGADQVLVISEWLAEKIAPPGSPVADRVMVLRSGVSTAQLGHKGMMVAEARARLDEADERRTVVGYTGHLYATKGVDFLIDVAALLDPERFVCWIVGGSEADVQRVREQAEARGVRHMRFFGWVDPSSVALYQRASDILTAPYPSTNAGSRYHASPLKVFEYMAAERPVVASDLPTLREVFTSGHNALLLPPDDPRAWADACMDLADRPELGRRLSEAALETVGRYSWPNRARKLLHAFDPAEHADGSQAPHAAQG